MIYKRGFSIKKIKSALILIFTVFFLFLFSLLIDRKLKLHLTHSLNPFRRQEFVTNILAPLTKKPSEGRNIFFHETSGLFKLNARQACAVESAGSFMFILFNQLIQL